MTYSNQVNKNLDIEISPKYQEVMESLVYFRQGTIELYHGGNVTRKDSGLSWVSPLTIFNQNNNIRTLAGAYHLIYVNFDPTVSQQSIPKLIPFVGCEAGIKCADCNCRCNEKFNELLELYNDAPYIILRRSFLSNPAFPYITKYQQPNPEDEELMMEAVLRQLSEAGLKFEIDRGYLNYESKCLFEALPVFIENDQLTIYGPRLIHNEIGDFYGYSVYFKSDVWENYEIISGKPIDLTKITNQIVRFDSGCDSGQIYEDLRCDCKHQFLSALRSIQGEGQGIIIHIPSHDGRGYGMAGKMETELYKSGRKGFVHDPGKPLNTVQAAELLYGEKYDIRTYTGAAQILRALGLTQVRVLTDNSDKFRAIKASGIEVVRVKTGTSKDECNEHIEAKHRTPPYNDQAWLES